MKGKKQILFSALLLLCILFLLFDIVLLMFGGWEIIEDSFADFPEYSWIRMPIVCLFVCLPIPVVVWLIYTAWRFSFGLKTLTSESLSAYLRVTFWFAIVQAVIGFLIPFTVSHFLHEGNPAMVIAWVSMMCAPLFVAALAMLIRGIIQEKREVQP